MARIPRQNPRRQIDQLAREAERAIEAQRENVILPDHVLDEAASVKRSDVDRTVEFFQEANAGTDVEHLLDGPPSESEGKIGLEISQTIFSWFMDGSAREDERT